MHYTKATAEGPPHLVEVAHGATDASAGSCTAIHFWTMCVLDPRSDTVKPPACPACEVSLLVCSEGRILLKAPLRQTTDRAHSGMHHAGQ